MILCVCITRGLDDGASPVAGSEAGCYRSCARAASRDEGDWKVTNGSCAREGGAPAAPYSGGGSSRDA